MTARGIRSGSAKPFDQDNSGLLRVVLKLDAVATGAVGVLSLAAGPVLDETLGIPMAALSSVGALLIIYAMAIWSLGTRQTLNRTAIRAAIAINLLYGVDMAVVLAAGWFDLTASGIAFILFQAVAVALFASAQYYSLRRVRWA